MSDLFETRHKTEAGTEWRGEINVDIDGETQTLTVRQLNDTEFWDVMSKIDTDELEELDNDIPEEKAEEYADLQEKDTLTDEEKERLSDLQSEIGENDVNLFDVISTETFEGIKQVAKYAVEPDEEDIQRALREHANDIEDRYGQMTNENAHKYLNDHFVKPMIEDSVDFTSFVIGVKAFGETLDNAGN